MNFFEQQDEARRNTKWLLLLFVAAVILLIGITNIVIATFFVFGPGIAYGQNTFYWITAVVVGSISIAILARWMELSRGGVVVAEGLGGIPIQPNTDNPDEKRCLNVVAEMALASGMPVPEVYVLDDQISLNAFAAGTSPADAVIGVTRGAVEQFDREQLQGVIGHEFSHILNGDMCLNIRLMALLRGITFISDFGQLSLSSNRRRYRSSSSRESNAHALGLALLVIGWLGSLFANWIKAIISRQREFLADASAVQFTRNPQGIANALKLIAGYSRGTAVMSPGASEASHLFIAPALSSLFQVFATHPPLDVRIRRLEPSWDGEYIERTVSLRLKEDGRHSSVDLESEHARPGTIHAPLDQDVMVAIGAGIAHALSGQAPLPSVDSTNLEGAVDHEESGEEVKPTADGAAYQPPPIVLNDEGLPRRLANLAREPFGAMALCVGMIVSTDNQQRDSQIKLVERCGIKGLSLHVRQLADDLADISDEYRLPLIELCLPSLKLMSAQQYKTFRELLLAVSRSDKRIELFEWCLYQLLTHYLNPGYGLARTQRSRYKKVVEVKDACQLVLSLLAYAGHSDPQAASDAFTSAMVSLDHANTCILPEEECVLENFSTAVNRLGQCYPLLKPRIIKSMLACIYHNQELQAREVEIITSIAAAMDCPLPDLKLE